MNGKMDAVSLRFETAKPLTRLANTATHGSDELPINVSEPKRENALLSFLELLGNEVALNHESEILKAKELQDKEKLENIVTGAEVVDMLQNQFYMQHIDFDIFLNEMLSGSQSIMNRQSIFNEIKPSITELDSFGAWRCITNQTHDDAESIIAEFQQSLLNLQEEFLDGFRSDYTVIDANNISDDINSVRWKSVTTLIPSYHVFRDKDLNVCGIISFVSKSFLKRLADFHVQNLERICDESFELQNNRFLSASGAALSRRNGQSFLVRGVTGIKLLNLALLELLFELIVSEGQRNRSLPVLLSSSYFPSAQRVPSTFTWLQNDSTVINHAASAAQAKSSFRISGILNPTRISQFIEKLNNRFTMDINKRQKISTYVPAVYSRGYDSLEKDPVWSYSQSNSLLSSFREAVAPVKPLTRLAQLNQRSQIDTNLKDPFLSVTSKDTIFKNEESNSEISANNQKKRFSLKRKIDLSPSYPAVNDDTRIPNFQTILKFGYFRRVPHFAIVSVVMQGKISREKKIDCFDISQLIWQSQNDSVHSRSTFLEKENVSEELFTVIQKKNFIMSLHPIDINSFICSGKSKTQIFLLNGIDDNWMEEELVGPPIDAAS